MGTSVNIDDQWEELPGDDNLYKGRCLQNQIFYNYSPSFQRLADDAAWVFYAEKLLDDFYKVLQRLKACIDFEDVLIV
jgi:hypothetical protein